MRTTSLKDNLALQFFHDFMRTILSSLMAGRMGFTIVSLDQSAVKGESILGTRNPDGLRLSLTKALSTWIYSAIHKLAEVSTS